VKNRPTQTRDPNYVLKEFSLTSARLYVNSMSEMYIPTSLWEQTRHLDNQIFDAMPLDALNDLMNQAFTLKSQQMHFCNEFSLLANISSQPKQIFKFKALLTPLEINVTPDLVDDLSRFYEFVQNYSISLDLKQYRPQRKPVVVSEDEQEESPALRKKRKLIVRDWFFFVVWYVRLRKLLFNFYSEQLIEHEIEANMEQRYKQMLGETPSKDQIKRFVEQEYHKQNSPMKNKFKEQEGKERRKWEETQQLIKLQSVKIKVYESLEKFKVKKGANLGSPDQGQTHGCLPSFEALFDTMVIENSNNY